jgi:hypothetical protein
MQDDNPSPPDQTAERKRGRRSDPLVCVITIEVSTVKPGADEFLNAELADDADARAWLVKQIS